MVLQFGDIASISNLPASQSDFLENHILSGELANECWDTEFGEVWQEDLK
jgi:hypothetical protein